MSAPQLRLHLVPPRRTSPASTHIARAGIIARQIPGIRHRAGKRYAVHLLLTELKRALAR